MPPLELPLAGLRIGITGAIPEREYWQGVPDLDRLVLSFICQLSALVMEYGGQIVHGVEPLLTPIIAELGSQYTKQRTAPLVLVAPQVLVDIPRTVARAISIAKNVELKLIPPLGEGAPDDIWNGLNLTATRLRVVEESDVLVSVGGKLHWETGFNVEIAQQLATARWYGLPCFVVAGFGGRAGERERELLDELSKGNGLRTESQIVSNVPSRMGLARWSEDLDENVGRLILHLAQSRAAFKSGKRDFERRLYGTDSPAGALDFVQQCFTRHTELARALEAANMPEVLRILRSPPAIVPQLGIAKVVHSRDVRNVIVIGHLRSGKTSLVSAMLYTSGASAKLGSVDAGSSVTDYDEEAIVRQMTISTGIAPVEWHNCKINLLDTPGSPSFAHHAMIAMDAAEAALVLVDGVAGVQAVTEKFWQYAEKINLPRVIVVSRLDRELANYEAALESLLGAFGRRIVPVQLPIGSNKNLKGVVDLVTLKAYTYDLGGTGKGKEAPIPADLQAAAQEGHEKLVEILAEGNDELLIEFFDKGTISEEHLIPALHEAIRDENIFPVLVTSGLGNIGADQLLSFIADFGPSPPEQLANSTYHEASAAAFSMDGSETLYVFSTVNDPFAGRISYFKVLSGVIKTGSTLQNLTRGSSEHLEQLYVPHGEGLRPISELYAGDIGAMRVKNAFTGDTLGNDASAISHTAMPLPDPAIMFALEPKSLDDESRLAVGLQKLIEEDPLIRFYRDKQTQEYLIGGASQEHIEVIVSKLKKRYHTEVSLKAPRIPYRETIRSKADGQGRYRKRTPERRYYAECKIKIEPMERGKGFEFVNDIFGGAIPKNFIPAVEKGIVEAARRGFLAGYPVVDVRVILYDGNYDEVDSTRFSFNRAARLAFRRAMEQANPTLLEPIMRVETTVPDEYAGSIMGDLSSRRGRIQGMENMAGCTIVKAEVPMAEMLSYSADLISISQGRGSFSMEMSHYDSVPSAEQEKVLIRLRQEREQAEIRKLWG